MVRKYIAAAILFIAVVCLANSPVHAKKKKSSPEDLAKVVQLTRALEKDPLSADADAARSWLLTWLIKAPDITVTISPLLGPLPNDDYTYSDQVFTQMTFSSAAFIIENPEIAKANPCEEQKAGLAGALAAYEAIVAKHPDAKYPFLDKLLNMTEPSEIDAYLKQKAPESCMTTAD
ncbi:MAG: hypothetical protein ACE5H7_17785 [Acidiferrobacterales bacterium]